MNLPAIPDPVKEKIVEQQKIVEKVKYT